jgi:hypothetical protein
MRAAAGVSSPSSEEGAVSIGWVPETASALAGLPLHAKGKVREMYDVGDRLLMVA